MHVRWCVCVFAYLIAADCDITLDIYATELQHKLNSLVNLARIVRQRPAKLPGILSHFSCWCRPPFWQLRPLRMLTMTQREATNALESHIAA